MVAHWAIQEEGKVSVTKFIHSCVITAGDRRKHNCFDMIERSVIYAQSPFELEDVISCFLMKLGNKQSFENPKAAGNLINMFHVQEGIEMLLHGLKFSGPIIG